MPARAQEEIEAARAAGKGKHELPVAIIQNGTTPEEKCVTGKVSGILFRSQYEGLANPAVIIIGEAVRLRPSVIKEYVRADAPAFNIPVQHT